MADFLGIVLPFKLTFFGSRSTVHSAGLPLYLEENGSNETEFREALYLLNFDISYLCFTQGIKIEPSQFEQTFFNFYRCLKAPELGRWVHSLFESKKIVAKSECVFSLLKK